MKIEFDTFFGPTATRPVEDLEKEERNRNGGVYLQCFNFFGDFPGFGFLKHCGEVSRIAMLLNPEMDTKLDFGSMPVPASVTHVGIDGGRQGRRKGQEIQSFGSTTILGLNHLPNLKDLGLRNFPKLRFGDESLLASLQEFSLWNPGILDTSAVPENSAKTIHLLGFDRRQAHDFNFISRFSGMEILWMDYCNGMEALPAFHPEASLKVALLTKARRLKNIKSLASARDLEEVGFRFCPLLTREDYLYLRELPNLKKFYVSDKKQAVLIKELLPNVEIVIDRITLG